MITRITIDSDDPLAILRQFIARTPKLERGLNQTLMDDRPYSVGSVITYERQPEIKREWK